MVYGGKGNAGNSSPLAAELARAAVETRESSSVGLSPELSGNSASCQCSNSSVSARIRNQSEGKQSQVHLQGGRAQNEKNDGHKRPVAPFPASTVDASMQHWLYMHFSPAEVLLFQLRC